MAKKRPKPPVVMNVLGTYAEHVAEKERPFRECQEIYEAFKTKSKVIAKLDCSLSYPDLPEVSDIANYGKEYSDRKFTRFQLPALESVEDDGGNVIDTKFSGMTKEEEKAMLNQVLKYRIHGYWFFSGGNLEYITGDHWYYLNFIKIKLKKIDERGRIKKSRGFPRFVDSDRNWFIFWKTCEVMRHVFGMMYMSKRRDGKALDINIPIPTPIGWRKMSDIQEGDYVFGRDGKPTMVTFATEVQHNRSCYKFYFSDKTELIADEDHQWLAYNKSSRQFIGHARWKAKEHLVTTKVMYDSQQLINTRESNWSILNCEPVEYSKKELEIPPYILGLWLGDGTHSHPELTNIDKEIIDKWCEYGKSIGLTVSKKGEITYQLVVENGFQKPIRNPFMSKLRKYNLVKNKHVPSEYLQSSVEDRIDLLRGLMDTDGCINKNGITFEICSKNESFIEGIKELVESLGYKSTKTSKFNKNVNKSYYYLRFGWTKGQINPFNLKRKSNQVYTKSVGGWKTTHRYITKIEKVDSIPVKCISVDNESSSYLCGKNFLVTHNTYKSLATFMNSFTMDRECVFGIQAQKMDIAKKIFKEFVYLWRELPRHDFFFPTHKGDLDPDSTLDLMSPKVSARTNKYAKLKAALNNSIDYEASTATAYDGRDLWRLLVDEACKMTECDINELVSTMKETMGVGPVASGKMIITSTAENIGGKTLPQFEELWKASSLNRLNAFGVTSSGFMRFFQSAAMGYEYDPEEDGKIGKEFQIPTIDEFGISITENSTKILMELRRLKKGQDLIRFIRKFPFTEEEAFANTDTNSPFDLEKLTEHEEYDLYLEENGALPLVRGNLVWRVYHQEVMWIPDPNGRWLISWHPPDQDQNQFQFDGYFKRPTRSFVGLGFDPFSHKMHEDKRFSNAGVSGMCTGHPDHPTIGTVVHYVFRAPSPNEQYDDVIKTAVYFSAPIYVENQKHAFIDWCDFNGFGGYIERNPLNQQQKNAGVSTRGDDTRNALINGAMAFVSDRLGAKIGINENGDQYSYYEPFPFLDLIRELKKFNPQNWGPFDGTVAFMLSLLSLRKQMYATHNMNWKAEDWFAGENDEPVDFLS